MIELPPRLPLTEALPRIGGRVCVWASASVRDWAVSHLPWPLQDEPSADADWLVVAGAGRMIDQAKALKLAHPNLRLAVAPSLWGSGAEASPVVVLDNAGVKDIRVDAASLPELIIDIPEFASSVPLARARLACGDAWSHALEGWLSPLATDDLRTELAQVIDAMAALPLAADARWFELSALACAGQARSSVGLIHGIAHELEAPLQAAGQQGPWHHARLCSLYLLPVMRYNAARSEKLARFAEQFGVDLAQVWMRLAELHDHGAYQATLPALQQHWRQVLRNPCSRTNSALVNAQALDFLLAFEAA
jgi:alcohol dehydrogenase class IV